MKRYKYAGTFISAEGNMHEITVYCNGLIQAIILLTAKAIEAGKHYQLNDIIDEKGKISYIDDILRVGDLVK